MTHVQEGPDPMVCRVITAPSSMLGYIDGALGLLCAPSLWTRGDDPLSMTVEDTIAFLSDVIENMYEGGCPIVGEIVELATNELPSWALLCDGTTYLGEDYPELWAVISDGLKTDESHFRTPDRYQRFGMFGPPTGSQGGENTHVLTSSEMPSHTHVDTGHTHAYDAPVGEFLAVGPGETPVVLAQSPALTLSGSAVLTDAGGDAGHNNLPQWEGTLIVIRARSQ
jgi:microcystin-dependent protein